MTAETEQHPSTRRPWSTPRLTELDISVTKAGPSPNIQETVLTNDTFAIS